MKKWAGNLLLSLSAIIVTIALLEIALRFVYPAHETWRLYRIPDAELGWVLESGAEFSRLIGGHSVPVRYNSDGFRDDEPSAPKPKDAANVVVLGDSYMEANMVPLERVFHKQLEQLAKSDGRELATWNLGVAGYGTLQEYMTFKKAGEKHKPDLVLLAFYLHNDVRNNAQYMNSGAIGVRGGVRKRPYLDDTNETGWKILEPDFDELQRRYLKDKNSLSFRIRHNSVLLSLYRNTRRALKSRFDAFHGGGTLMMHRCDSAKKYERAWRTTERILERLNEDVEALGAKLVVFSVPAVFDSDMAFAQEMGELASENGLDLCIENSPGYGELRAILERQDIAYVDLVPDFRKAVTDEKQKLFVRGDWHWNGDGHEIAARAVYDALKARGLLSD